MDTNFCCGLYFLVISYDMDMMCVHDGQLVKESWFWWALTLSLLQSILWDTRDSQMDKKPFSLCFLLADKNQ
jgi:hypothetical protein